MSEVKKFINRSQSKLQTGLNTCIFGEIIKIELKHMRVDVKVDFEEETIVMRAPIATYQTKEFIIRPPYQVGDTVLLIISQKDIDPILYAGGEHSKRQHELDDALVISGITPFTEPLLDDFTQHEEDFVIGKRDFSAKFIIKKNGEIIVSSDETINLESQKNISLLALNGIITAVDSRGVRL